MRCITHNAVSHFVSQICAQRITKNHSQYVCILFPKMLFQFITISKRVHAIIFLYIIFVRMHAGSSNSYQYTPYHIFELRS